MKTYEIQDAALDVHTIEGSYYKYENGLCECYTSAGGLVATFHQPLYIKEIEVESDTTNS